MIDNFGDVVMVDGFVGVIVFVLVILIWGGFFIGL